VQIYLPVHQAACSQEILNRIDAFRFDNEAVVRHVEHFDDSCRTDIPFRYAGVETVASKIIEPVHIQLPAYKLMQETFRIFVLEDLNGKAELPVHLLVHPFHEYKGDFFVRNSFDNGVFEHMRERTVTDVVQQDSRLYSFSLAVKDKITFGGQLGDSFAHQVEST